jgi:hypothetical protein
MQASSQYSMPERKEVTERIERMKKEQAKRDRLLKEAQETEQEEVSQSR